MSDPSSQVTSSGTSARFSGPRRILVLDDEISIQRLLKMILEEEGYEVHATDDGGVALQIIVEKHIDLIIQDLRMPKMDGLAFLKTVKEKHPHIPSIVVTAFGTTETAVEAMRLGAYTHLNKPFDNDEMRQTVSRALERIEIHRKSTPKSIPFLDMIGNTALMAQVSSLIERVAPTDSTILITGESGTGKELVARAIHFGSLRADQPFVPVNCGAFTETLLESELFGHLKGSFTNAINDRKGLFESADRGTLFLDEVGEMTMSTQVKLLRVLETRMFKPVGGTRETKVDVRFITATNRNLAQMVSEGNFREDLYYRLNVIPIELPPLRERKEDIPLLAGHFLARYAKRMNKVVSAIDDAVMGKLLAYDWPGNVRELENTIERAVALTRGERVTLADLSQTILNFSGTAIRRAAASSGLLPPAGSSMHAAAISGVRPATLSGQHSVASGMHAGISGAQPALIAPNPRSSAQLMAVPPVLNLAPGGFPQVTPQLPQDGLDLEQHLLEVERTYILQALERCNWNLTEAAKVLKMTFRSIRYRVSKLGIEKPSKDL